MDGAHPAMHGPRRANPEKSSDCKQSATPLETPPRRAGKKMVSRRSRFRSANRIAKMTNLASYFLASNGCEIELDPRHLRADYRPLARPLQGAVFGPPNHTRFGILDARFQHPGLSIAYRVAQGIDPRLEIFPRSLLANWFQKLPKPTRPQPRLVSELRHQIAAMPFHPTDFILA